MSSVASETGDSLPVPFIEVVSHAAKRATEITKNGRIGVIATTATINSNSYKSKIQNINPDIQVFQNDCPLFVPLVEAGWIDKNDEVTKETARRYLESLKEKDIDVLIMGCTHYPVITDIIREIMGDGVSLVNTGEYTAKAALQYIKENDMLSDKNGGVHRYYVSDRTESFSKTASILMGKEISGEVERVDIDHIKELF